MYFQFKYKKSFVLKMKENNVIYSCVFGMYSIYHKLELDGWDKVILTDKPEYVKADPCWTIKVVQKTHENDGVSNRFYKWLSHKIFPEYDNVVYFDSKVILKYDLNYVINNYIQQMKTNNKIGIFFNHPRTSCIYKETIEVVQQKRETQANCDNMMKLLREKQFPENIGLTENNIFIRNNKNATLNKAFEELYYIIHNMIKRDQLVFMYILWKYSILNKIMFLSNNDKRNFYIHQHIGVKFI